MVHRQCQFPISLESPLNDSEPTLSTNGSPSACPFLWQSLLLISEKGLKISIFLENSGEVLTTWLFLSILWVFLKPFPPAAMHC